MQPRDYLPILRKRWPLILGTVVVAVVASFLFAQLQTPIYRATVHMTAAPSRLDYGQTLVVENMLRQAARELQTDRLADEVNRRLDLDLPLERLIAKVRVGATTDDLTLTLEVDDTDPNRARDIAFAWADEYVKLNQNKMATRDPRERIEIELLDTPRPAVLNWPRRTQIMLAAALLGLLAGTMLAFLLEYLDDTVKSPEEVDRFLEMPLLAAVPTADAVPGGSASSNGRSARGTSRAAALRGKS